MRQWWEDARRYYREHHDLGAQCANYLFKHKRYRDDDGSEIELSARRIKPKGNEVNNLVRNKTAQVAGPATYEECWPTDQLMDRIAAEGANAILRHIFQSPRRRYKLARRRMVSQAFVTGVGYLRAEWYPHSEGLRFEAISHDRLFVCPGFQDMHDEACPYVIEQADLEIEDIVSRAVSLENPDGWQDTEDLWADNQGRSTTQPEFNRQPAAPRPDETHAKQTVTVLFCWERRSPVMEQRVKETRALLPDEQYMRCKTCGYATQDHERDMDGNLPLAGLPCPQCMNKNPGSPEVSYLTRVDFERTEESVLKYPNGRLRITAPYQSRLFYDGPWPERTRSYRYLQFRCYEHPQEHIGQNDVALHATKQAILDSLTRMAYEQMRTSKRVIVVAGGPNGEGLLDAANRPYRLSDENGHVAYTKFGTVQGMVQEFQGQGMPSALPTLYNMVHASMHATLGITDFGLTQDRSKDVAAASLQKIEEVGNIPVADHRDALNDEESIFKGVCLDMWVEHATPELALKALGPNGIQYVMALRNSDTRDMDVLVTASPAIRHINDDQMNRVMQWVQLARMDPVGAQVVAKMANIPPWVVREIQSAPMTMSPAVGNGTQPPNQAAAMGGAKTAPVQ